MKKLIFFLAVSIGIISCDSRTKLEKEISKIPVDIELIRFDKEFGSASISDIPKLKEEFPLFFPKQYADSIWENRMQDQFQKELYKTIIDKFPTEQPLVEDFGKLFQHIKYYFPQFEEPVIFTIVSDVDYRSKILEREGALAIGLDNYLGAESQFYQGISKYISKNMKPEMLISDVAGVYTKKYIRLPKQRTLLAQMIYFGKELYLKDLWLVSTTDAHKIGYTEEELKWANDNEADVWRYFVEQEVLYSPDSSLEGKFIKPAPFSKFGLQLDNESPGMIGRYMGWQIVKAFMDNTNTSVHELVKMKEGDIYQQSKYKPKK